jgi:hypothetical protein
MGFSSPIIASPVWPVSSTFAHVADGVLTTACSPRQPDYVAGTDESIAKLARQVVAIDRQKMVLASAAGGGARFTIWRGKTKLDPSEHSMEATQKKLLLELEAMHMSGFRPNGSGPGPVSWRLDSRVIEAAKKK